MSKSYSPGKVPKTHFPTQERYSCMYLSLSQKNVFLLTFQTIHALVDLLLLGIQADSELELVFGHIRSLVACQSGQSKLKATRCLCSTIRK